MMRKSDFDRSVEFVTRYYRHGFLSSRKGWRELNLSASRWRSWRIAAAVAGVVVLSASAAIYLHYDEPAVAQPERYEPVLADEVKRIEFSDAPLPEVVAEIERVYGVKVTGMPDESYRLTLSYEGSVADLVETINTLLGTHLTIEKEK